MCPRDMSKLQKSKKEIIWKQEQAQITIAVVVPLLKIIVCVITLTARRRKFKWTSTGEYKLQKMIKPK